MIGFCYDSSHGGAEGGNAGFTFSRSWLSAAEPNKFTFEKRLFDARASWATCLTGWPLSNWRRAIHVGSLGSNLQIKIARVNADPP